MKARPVGTFVMTSAETSDNFGMSPPTTVYWVEKVTSHTSDGSEVHIRWCQAESDRKAYIICTALNMMSA